LFSNVNASVFYPTTFILTQRSTNEMKLEYDFNNGRRS